MSESNPSRTWSAVLSGDNPTAVLRDAFGVEPARFIAYGVAAGKYDSSPSNIEEAARALTDGGVLPQVQNVFGGTTNTDRRALPRARSSSPGLDGRDGNEDHALKRVRLNSKSKTAKGVIAPSAAQLPQNGAGDMRWRKRGGANEHFRWRAEVLDSWTDHQGHPFEPTYDEETGEMINLTTVYPYSGGGEQTQKKLDLLAKLVDRSTANQYGTLGNRATANRDFTIDRPASHDCRPDHKFGAKHKKNLSAVEAQRVQSFENQIALLESAVERQALILHENIEAADVQRVELFAIIKIISGCSVAKDIQSAVGTILGVDLSEPWVGTPVSEGAYPGLQRFVDAAVAKEDFSGVDLVYLDDNTAVEPLRGLLRVDPSESYLVELAQAQFGLLLDAQRTAYRKGLAVLAPTIPSAPTANKRPSIAPQDLVLGKQQKEQLKIFDLESESGPSSKKIAELERKLAAQSQRYKKGKGKFRGKGFGKKSWSKPKDAGARAGPAVEETAPDAGDSAGRGRGGGRGSGRGGGGRGRGRGSGRGG